MSDKDAAELKDWNGDDHPKVTGITASCRPTPRILMNHQLNSAERVREETS